MLGPAMTQDLTAFWLANITPEWARDAYRFHKSTAENDPHIWPRTEDQIRTFIEDGSLFGAWREDKLVALCYAAFSEKENVWEIGGLTVDPSVRAQGIGTILVRFTLAHTLVYNQPWANGQEIVSHVHEDNNKPRGILDKVGFKYSRPVELLDDEAPRSMKRNSEGKVVGHEFEYTPEGLKSLAEWFKQDFDKLNIEFKLGLANVDHVRAALDEMASQY